MNIPASLLSYTRLTALPLAALLTLPCTAPADMHRGGEATETTIAEVQGAAHRSPLLGQRVTVTGVVTAVLPLRDAEPTPHGFWLQSTQDDSDTATSEGVFVACEATCQIDVGMRVRLTGEVQELPRPGQLSVTQIATTEVEVLEAQVTLPAVVELGRGSLQAGSGAVARRMAPGPNLDDDELRRFEPDQDAIDFYESLEGMRVRVIDPLVVGPTNHYGEIVVLPSQGIGSYQRSQRGGVVLTEDNTNPQRLIINLDALLPRRPGARDLPQVSVGERFDGPITGVLSYDYGTYRLLPTESLPLLLPQRMVKTGSVEAEEGNTRSTPGSTTGKSAGKTFSIASYNVLNLDATDPDSQFRRLAKHIVQAMDSPDILALQEIQDDNGAEPGPFTSANQTLKKLIFAVVSAGGPRYQYRQIDPLPEGDGGQPGGNIRVVYLFDPDRVSFIDRGEAGPTDAVGLEPGTSGSEVSLTLSPGRIDPENRAFGPERSTDVVPSAETGSRKSLAAEVRVGHGDRAQRLFLINNHLTSKRADDRDFGDRQPPVRHSEKRRLYQTRVIGDFVTQLLRLDPDAWIVVLGDMNEHEFRPPMRHLVDEVGLVNLIESVPLEERYTYNYQGNSQVLDHILISTALAREAQPELKILHINSDFPSKMQASDHDPLVLRIQAQSDE